MINDFRSRSKITKLRQIEWLFQAIAIVIAGWFQGIIISHISTLGLFGELPVEGVWFDTIKIIILVILYLVFYSILCFTSSRFLAKIYFRAEYIAGSWVECLAYHRENNWKIEALGITHIEMNANGVSYEGENYDLNFLHKCSFQANSTDYDVKGMNINLSYVSSTTWITGAGAKMEESQGILRFNMERKENAKVKPPTYHTGEFYKRLNDNGDCQIMNFFAIKIENTEDLKKLLENNNDDSTNAIFKTIFEKYLKLIKKKYVHLNNGA